MGTSGRGLGDARGEVVLDLATDECVSLILSPNGGRASGEAVAWSTVLRGIPAEGIDALCMLLRHMPGEPLAELPQLPGLRAVAVHLTPAPGSQATVLRPLASLHGLERLS